MPASVRLLCRAVGRSMGASPSTHLLRTQCFVNLPTQAQPRWYTSDSTNQPAGSNASSPNMHGGEKASAASASLKNRPTDPNAPPEEKNILDQVRLPRAVQAIYLKPLRREAEYGVPSCNLQLRSFNANNLEFFADFALRAAYYLGLPAYGPVALPRIVERWTVPRGSFIHKKSQENFERKTLRRLIQIKDGHPETVQIWLAFLKKHAYYGIAMKANVWEFAKLGVGETMDVEMARMKDQLDSTLDRFAFKTGTPVEKRALEIIDKAESRRVVGMQEYRGVPHYKMPPDWDKELEEGGEGGEEEEEEY